MKGNWRTSLRVMGAIIHHDMMLFKQDKADNIINLCVARGTMALIYQYIMPFMGVTNYGAFMAVADLAHSGYFRSIGLITHLVGDLQGDQAISYYLTLPFPQTLVFVSMALSYALRAMMISIVLLPVMKLLLGGALSFEHASWGNFAIIFILSHIFFGFFALFFASILRRLEYFDNVWIRIMLPLWMTGCHMFPWKIAYTFSPWLGYALLLNPLTACLEGFRGALLGYDNTLPFWFSVTVLVVATLLFGTIAIKKLKKRLDCL